jgi:hypothetical protein
MTGFMPYACTMNLTDAEIRELKGRIAVLKTEHRDLDTAISHMEATSFPDQLTLKRLKKHKLVLKDEIFKLGMLLVPDIPA